LHRTLGLLVVLVGARQVLVTAVLLLLEDLALVELVIMVVLVRQYLALAPAVVALVERVSPTLAVTLQEQEAQEPRAALQAAQWRLPVAVEVGDLQQPERVDQALAVRVELTLHQQPEPEIPTPDQVAVDRKGWQTYLAQAAQVLLSFV
jgi:hypothetical protein